MAYMCTHNNDHLPLPHYSSLFSIDTASVFYSDSPEDDMNSWYYSKHVVEQERQEHIKRLQEQGLEIPPELLLEEKGINHLTLKLYFQPLNPDTVRIICIRSPSARSVHL
jgi:hypothetical protein